MVHDEVVWCLVVFGVLSLSLRINNGTNDFHKVKSCFITQPNPSLFEPLSH